MKFVAAQCANVSAVFLSTELFKNMLDVSIKFSSGSLRLLPAVFSPHDFSL